MAYAASQVVEFDTIDSTNSEAHRRAAAGERGPLWIRAERQEAGRGRSGRGWSSPAGNLSLTHLFVPGCPASRLHQLSFVAGLWMHDAVSPYVRGQERLQLKWPNDLLVGPAKVGGILVESSTYGGDVVAIVGTGLNIAVSPPVSEREVGRLADFGDCPPRPNCFPRFRRRHSDGSIPGNAARTSRRFERHGWSEGSRLASG